MAYLENTPLLDSFTNYLRTIIPVDCGDLECLNKLIDQPSDDAADFLGK